MKIDSDFYSRFGKAGGQGITKYARLRLTILNAIESGHWAPGDKLPTELEFTKMTPYGLGTVQRALNELTHEGIIVRQQGHGSFVARPRKSMALPWHCRFLDDSGTDFLPIFPKVLYKAKITEYGPWSPFLDQKGDNIIRIDRRISINHEFNVFSRIYINADRFGSILDKPASELESANLKMVLKQNFNLPITVVSQDLLMVRFPADICSEIGVKRGTTGIHLDAVASAGRTVHLYYQEWFIPPTRRKLRIVENSTIPD
ncbi:MAG: GntR family transcriptional regulator [Desulfobacteraceae bacterium]|nr:MAG: GntR family transcriptional regulator [Desulfobacteraceae bacterium]